MRAIAHVGGIPIEETVASFGPALLIALGAAPARLRVSRAAPMVPRLRVFTARRLRPTRSRPG